MIPKFGNSRISMRDFYYHNFNFVKISPENKFFEEVLLVQAK